MKTSKKIDGKLVGIPKLRNDIWLAALIIESKQKNLSQLIIWLSRQGLDGDQGKWNKFNSHRNEPLPSLIDDVDKILKGTARVYKNGSKEFPLFSVLNANLDLCKRFLSGVLSSAGLYGYKKSLVDKGQSLLEYVLFDELDYQGDRSDTDFKKMVRGSNRNIVKRSQNDQKKIQPRTVLAIIAFWNIVLKQDDADAMRYAEYLMYGILGKPIEQAFGKSVADYVQELFEDAG
ncbi:hypothetical protein ACO0K7_10540 [Undibacterium sp. Ji67W]|uniref:hypothetical protein n=1 Tax=Undibacterium sp. Ji67W TaxID=3413042 RepID=UPI003BF07EE5